jgi:lantibiotic modifying enzyme
MAPERPPLDTAVALAAGVCRDALWHRGRCTWLGDQVVPDSTPTRLQRVTLGPSLYDGTIGIALVLARLHAATGEATFARTAAGAAEQSLVLLERAPRRAGLYSGTTGVALALTELGEQTGSEKYLDAARSLLADLPAWRPGRTQLDVISGAAGVLVAALRLSGRGLAPGLPESAVGLGEVLLDRAIREGDDDYWSWQTSYEEGRPPLAGLSHGTAGIAWALGELYATTGSARYREAAMGACRRERHLFDPKVGNWPDLRRRDRAAFMTAWCHGAPGIGLSRLRLHQILGHDSLLEDARAAYRTTRESLSSGRRFGTSLCHGWAGNAEIAFDAASFLGDAAASDEIRGMAVREAALEAPEWLDWPSGVRPDGTNPGLMLGTIGVAHLYLRLHDPVATASVLLI